MIRFRPVIRNLVQENYVWVSRSAIFCLVRAIQFKFATSTKKFWRLIGKFICRLLLHCAEIELQSIGCCVLIRTLTFLACEYGQPIADVDMAGIAADDVNVIVTTANVCPTVECTDGEDKQHLISACSCSRINESSASLSISL